MLELILMLMILELMMDEKPAMLEHVPEYVTTNHVRLIGLGDFDTPRRTSIKHALCKIRV